MSGTQRTRRRQGRRERILRRSRPTVVHHLLVDDDTAARAELAEAREALDTAGYILDQELAERTRAEAEKRVKAARKAVEACYEPITLTALPPGDYEAIASKPEFVPPDGEDVDAAGRRMDALARAVLLACVPTGEEEPTGEEWEELLAGGLSHGERRALLQAAIDLNDRTPDGSIPKD